MTGSKLVAIIFIFLAVNGWGFRDEKPIYKWSPITFSSGHKKLGRDLYRPFFVQQQWTPYSSSQYSNFPTGFSERGLQTRSRSCAKHGSSCDSTADGRWNCCEGLICERIRDRFGICIQPSWKTNNLHPIY